MNGAGTINIREANSKVNEELLKAFRMWEYYGKE
jgi:hypothetical protein